MFTRRAYFAHVLVLFLNSPLIFATLGWFSSYSTLVVIFIIRNAFSPSYLCCPRIRFCNLFVVFAFRSSAIFCASGRAGPPREYYYHALSVRLNDSLGVWLLVTYDMVTLRLDLVHVDKYFSSLFFFTEMYDIVNSYQRPVWAWLLQSSINTQ